MSTEDHPVRRKLNKWFSRSSPSIISAADSPLTTTSSPTESSAQQPPQLTPKPGTASVSSIEAPSQLNQSLKTRWQSASLDDSCSSAGRRIVNEALSALSEDEYAAVKKYASLEDPKTAFYQAYQAAEARRNDYEKAGVLTVRGHKIKVRGVADNIVKFLDKFKDVGDLLASLDPAHAGIPWAAVKLLLAVPLAVRSLMAAVLSGLESVLRVGNRLKIYYHFLSKLKEDSPGLENFEAALLTLQTRLLKFLAQAIILYQENALSRAWIAVWGADEVTSFDAECERLARDAEVEAHNSDRDIFLDLHAKLKDLDMITDSLAKLSIAIQIPKLEFAEGAPFDSEDEEGRESRVLKNTRVDLLNQIYDWAECDDRGDPCIFWLQGSAGTGKSTISRTVAAYFDNIRLLGASFFFKRDESDRDHAKRLFTTIATQLVYSFPAIEESVLQEIEAVGNISGKTLEYHFVNLITEPLSKSYGDDTTVILVIDALDECERTADITRVLSLLERVVEAEPARLRVFLTSRPEINDLHTPKDKSRYRIMNLDDVTSTKNDIAAFFTSEFAKMTRKPTEPEDWPGAKAVKELAKMAEPSFICASIICRFINRRDRFPEEQLKLIQRFQYSTLASDIDKTYLPVMAQLDGEGGDTPRQQYHKLLEMIVLLADPLSVPALVSLLNEDEMDLRHVKLWIGRLSSVLRMPVDEASPVRVFHHSFRDFLLDPKKRDKSWFWVDETEAHGKMTQKCFDLMTRDGALKRNPCEFKRPGLQRSEIDQNVLDGHITAQLQYACRFWTYHMEKKGQDHLPDANSVLVFLQQHFLHWMETLGWMGRIGEGVSAIISLRSRFSAGKIPDLSAFLDDTYRFLLRNRHIVDVAPLQIYSSALIFAPQSSLVRATFAMEIDGFSKLPDMPETWGQELLQLEGHTHNVSGIAISPDNCMIASVSMDGTIRLWSLATGDQLLEIKIRDMSGVAFRPESPAEVLVSYGFHSVILWDASTGVQQKEITFKDLVSSVAISPDGLLACASGNDVRLWSEVEDEIVPFSAGVDVVQFDLDLKTNVLLVLDSKKMLIFWDYSNRREVRTLFLDGMNGNALALSLERGLLAYWIRSQNLIQICDTTRGDPYRKISCANVSELAFAPNRQWLASFSGKLIQLWDVKTGTELMQFDHDYTGSRLTFSWDEQILASVEGGCIQLRDLGCSSKNQYRKDDSRFWHCTCSADGSKFAYLGMDNAVTVLDFAAEDEVRKFDYGELIESEDKIMMSTEGRWLTCQQQTGDDGGKLVINDLSSRTEPWEINTKTCCKTTFSQDSRFLAISSGRTVDILDLADRTENTGTDIRTAAWAIAHLAFSRDEKFLAASGPCDEQSLSAPHTFCICVWDLTVEDNAKNSRVLVLPGVSNPLAFSNDGRLLACVSFSEASLFDLTSPELVLLRKICPIGFSSFLHFSEDDISLVYRRGAVRLPSENIISHLTPRAPDIFCGDEWITVNGENHLWLPRDCRYRHINTLTMRGSNVAYANNRICIIASDGSHKFFEIKL